MNTDTSLDIVPTRAMLLKANAATEFKATVYEGRKRLPKTSPNLQQTANGPDRNTSAGQEFDLKRAKHEVLNFGISGFESKDKEAAKIALAIRLGAKPPKNAYTNYKELIAEKKEQRVKAADRSAMLQLGKNAQGGASVTYKKMHNARRKKKLSGPITSHYGVVNPKIHKKKK